jgi:hypothetical protein
MTGWTEDGLVRSWRALANRKGTEDWRFVHLTKLGHVSIEAGCHFPLGLEALIVCFPNSWKIDTARLPEGKGFDVIYIDDETEFIDSHAIALIRRPEGTSEIFTVMVVDILRALESAAVAGHQEVLDAFIERVKEWQHFMARSHRPLTCEAQVGLFGELWLLRQLMNTSLGSDALNCWQGPLSAAQDFHIRGGAVEVKSTICSGSFLAKINSIEQLDSEKSPIFLCALRFEEVVEGLSLSEAVSALRVDFNSVGKNRGFDALLMVMGYIDEHEPLYYRRLALKDVKIFRSEDEMPRLVRTALPAAIRSAAYILDLDAIEAPSIVLDDLINELGLN